MRHSIHDIFYGQARELELAGRYDEALALLYQGHRWAPDDPDLWLRLGVLSFLMTDREWLAATGREASHLGDMGAVNADLYLERACRLAPGAAAVFFWRGWVAHALYQDAARARVLLAEAIDRDVRHPYAHAALARIELAEREAGYEGRAIAHLDAALASLPESARFHYDRGACLAGLGEDGEAREAFASAVRCPRLALGETAMDRYLAETFGGDGKNMAALVARFYPELTP